MGIIIIILVRLLILCRYVKVRESLWAWVILWVNTILNHIDAMTILPGHDGPCIVYESEWYQKNKILSITHTLLVSITVTSSLEIPKKLKRKKGRY